MRSFFGNLLNVLGTREIFRHIYLWSAKKYLEASSPHITSAWVRRSLTSSDFTPLASDVDLTILIEMKTIPELMKRRSLEPRHLVRDVQIIATPFLADWEETGGFRNRQITPWIPLLSNKKLSRPETKDRKEIAFELCHEVYLLYSQLAPKLSQGNSASALKLGLELERIFDFWQTLDDEVLFVPRARFYSPDVFEDFSSFLQRQDNFWGELVSNLASPMDTYQTADLENEKTSFGSTLFLSIGNRPVFMLKDLTKLKDAKRKYGDHFIATANFIRLLKGSGIQEQSFLNQVAGRSNYYFKFCRQRLAHDLIGTLLQDADNARRLYFCFKNNQEFLYSCKGIDAPGWEKLKNEEVGTIPWDQDELLRHSLANLEVLASLG